MSLKMKLKFYVCHQPVKSPPPALLPKETLFEAELCGSDEDNFVYIRSSHAAALENYGNLQSLVAKEYNSMDKTHLLDQDIVPDRLVLLKQENNVYRAKILRRENNLIHCFKIDEGEAAVSLASQIFPITSQLQRIPCGVIKCRLHGTKFFDGLPHLELGFRLIIMSNIYESSVYTVEIVSITNRVPIVKMMRHGKSLANEIQKFIPTLCEPFLQKDGNSFDGEVLYVNYKACVWFRSFADDGLFSRIANVLEKYRAKRQIIKLRKIQHQMLLSEESKNLKPLSDETMTNNSSANEGEFSSSSSSGYDDDLESITSEEMWKENYFRRVFIAEQDGVCYRVNVDKFVDPHKVEVQFIDFGNRTTMSRKHLIDIRQVDENLAFIPPQCSKSRLKGFYRINTAQFWSFFPHCPNPSYLRIVLSDCQDEDDGIEIELFNFGSHESINQKWILGSRKHLALCDLKPCGFALRAQTSLNEDTDFNTSPLINQGALFSDDQMQLFLIEVGLPARLNSWIE